MSGLNPISFSKMRSEKQRHYIQLIRQSRYDKMAKKPVSDYYKKFVRPRRSNEEVKEMDNQDA